MRTQRKRLQQIWPGGSKALTVYLVVIAELSDLPLAW